MAESEERAYEWLARTAYLAFRTAAGGFNHESIPLPEWEDLPEAIREAWIVVAKVLVPEARVRDAEQDAASEGDAYEPGA